MRMDAQTGKDRQEMMSLTGAVHNFAKAPKNAFYYQYVIPVHLFTRTIYRKKIRCSHNRSQSSFRIASKACHYWLHHQVMGHN